MRYIFILLSLFLVFPAYAKKKPKKPEPIIKVVYVDNPKMRLYEDGVVNISYSPVDNEFDYRIKDNPVVVTVVQQGKSWVAMVYDPMQDRTLKVSRLEVIPVKKLKWYQKIFK